MRAMTLAVMLAALPGLASADHAALKVAVVPGIVVNLSPARVDALTQEMAEALTAELEVDAVGGVEVRRRLPAAGLPSDCVANDACIADVARRLEAQQLLFVVVIDTGSGGAIQIDSTWIDAMAHKSASRPAIDIAVLGDAKARFAVAAPKLLPDAKVRPKSSSSLGRMSDAVPRHFALPSYLTAGATAVGLGVGIGFGLSARSRYTDCSNQATVQGVACTQDRQDAIRRRALVADLGWLLAIGGTVATAVLFATSGEASHVIVEPIRGGAAVTATGSF
jgi:hypothetical protein